jgi:hypothetical protein
MSSSAFSRSFDSGRLRDERPRFHVTFSASKCYHPNDASVTESVNTKLVKYKSKALYSPLSNLLTYMFAVPNFGSLH